VDKTDHHTSITAAPADNDIIARILKGERELYALLLRRYNQRLYRVAMSIINDDTDVEDVMQSAYIKAWENLDKFQFKSSFATWLTRILINESLLRLKKRKQSPLTGDDNINMAMNQQHSGEPVTPFHHTHNLELRQALEKAIRELPDKYRMIFIMREMENMSIAETQACLDLTEVNVKVRLSRAKALLRNTLSTYYKEEDILHFHLSRCDRMVDLIMNYISITSH
jgi:RNA polymerase sigma factor (sigma-70 family)